MCLRSGWLGQVFGVDEVSCERYSVSSPQPTKCTFVYVINNSIYARPQP